MYQDEKHEPQLNELTKRLYAEGYTRENYPGYVVWGDWQNFSYKWEHELKFVWETPCGLLVSGDSNIGRGIACGDMSYNGIWYCPENNNPDIRCPMCKKECEYRIPGLRSLIRCACHQTSKPYDYENSIEKIESEEDIARQAQYIEITGGSYCACIEGSNGYQGGYYQIKYDVDTCIHYKQNGCDNEFCVIRKKPRDLTLVNVFYDIRRTWITRNGILEDKKVELTKGVKVFDHPISKTDAEIWMKLNKDGNAIFLPKHSRDDRSMQYFSNMHRQWPGYDYFEFHYEVENIRIDKPRPTRDLLQDLQDAAEGIDIRHASDAVKAAKEKKTQRRQDAKAAKIRHLEKQILTSDFDSIDKYEQKRIYKFLDEDRIEELRKQREQSLAKAAQSQYEIEQTSLF